MQEDKKISTVEGTLMLIITVTADILNFVPILSFVINTLAFMVIQMWLRMKGIKNLAYFSGSIIEFIPIVNVLPIRTGSMIITIWLANRPVAAQLASAGKAQLTKRPTITTIPETSTIQKRIKPVAE